MWSKRHQGIDRCDGHGIDMGAGIALHHRRCGRGMDCSRRSDRTSAGCRRVSAAVWMTRVMFPYIALISLTALASGVLNTYQHFSLPASAPVLLNLSFIVASLWIAPHLQMPVYALAYAVIVGGILQLAVQIPALARL